MEIMSRTNILINEAGNAGEVAALIEDLGLEMTGVELDPDSAAELTLGGLLHRHTDNINIK